MMSLLMGISFQKAAEGSTDVDMIKQQQIEKFLDLGEKGYMKDCLEWGSDKSFCEELTNIVKNDTKSFQQNQTSNTTNVQATKSYVDDENGFSLDYPSDWHQLGSSIFKGTREFSLLKLSDPKFLLFGTLEFGRTWFEIREVESHVKVIDKPRNILIGGEPAVLFSYSKDEKATMVAALMHNNTGYVFEYKTQKENLDKDIITALDIFGSIRFLN